MSNFKFTWHPEKEIGARKLVQNKRAKVPGHVRPGPGLKRNLDGLTDQHFGEWVNRRRSFTVGSDAERIHTRLQERQHENYFPCDGVRSRPYAPMTCPACIIPTMLTMSEIMSAILKPAPIQSRSFCPNGVMAIRRFATVSSIG